MSAISAINSPFVGLSFFVYILYPNILLIFSIVITSYSIHYTKLYDELLSPAGSFDALKQAVHNGADAVYLGGTHFGARAYANNFDNDQLIEAIRITSYNVCYTKLLRFITSGGMGTMGYAIPAAIGASFASPDKQIVAVCGDGSFQMSMSELATAVQYNLNVT